MIKKIVLLSLLVAFGANATEKPNYKVSRLSVQDVAVSCFNGQKPEIKNLGTVLIISCDAE